MSSIPQEPEKISFVPNEMSRQKKIGLVSVIFALLILLFLIGLIYRFILWEEWKNEAKNQTEIVVKTLQLQEGTKPIELVLPSITQAIRVTPIWSRVDGYLKNFYVDIGDEVKEGQLLAIIETPELDRQVTEVQAELANTEAQLGIAKITAERWQALFNKNPKAVALQEVEEKEAFYSGIIAAKESAVANFERLKQFQAFNHIVAPFDGIITVRNIEIGSLISSGSQNSVMQLFQIAKTDVIRAFVDVPQPFFRLIQPGDKADVLISEFPGKIFKGWVARTSESRTPRQERY